MQQSRMDCSVVNSSASFLYHDNDQMCKNVNGVIQYEDDVYLTNSTIAISANKSLFKWIISRVRFFIYASNPYEEMFEFEDQIPDYHTEVYPKHEL